MGAGCDMKSTSNLREETYFFPFHFFCMNNDISRLGVIGVCSVCVPEVHHITASGASV